MCNYVVSKQSLVIGSTIMNIVDLDRLAHTVLIDLIKQMISQTMIIVMIRVDMWMFAKSS